MGVRVKTAWAMRRVAQALLARAERSVPSHVYPLVPPPSVQCDPDIIYIPGVECRWGIPRGCRNPSPETCKFFGCDMRGGKTESA